MALLLSMLIVANICQRNCMTYISKVENNKTYKLIDPNLLFAVQISLYILVMLAHVSFCHGDHNLNPINLNVLTNYCPVGKVTSPNRVGVKVKVWA